MNVVAKLVDAITYKNKLPVNFKEEDRELFAIHISTDIHEAKLYSGKNIILTPEHIVLQGLKIWRQEQTNHYLWNKAYVLKRMIKFFLRPTKKLYGKYLLITDDWSWSYFHWTGDVLQKLYMVRTQLSEYTVLLPESFQQHSYILESLDLFKAKIYFFKADENLKIENLMIPAPIGTSGVFQYDVIKGLSAYLIQEASKSKISIGSFDKIYISRAGARHRKIKNEEEVCNYLQSLGFHIIHTENMSFVEQIQTMQSCKWLISLHGAGLTNELYTQEGSNILEIRHPKDFLNNCYYTMANALNLNYYYFLAAADSDNPHTSNMNIDMEDFKSVVLKFLEH